MYSTYHCLSAVDAYVLLVHVALELVFTKYAYAPKYAYFGDMHSQDIPKYAYFSNMHNHADLRYEYLGNMHSQAISLYAYFQNMQSHGVIAC